MNPLFDDMYMKKHLAEYILFQIEQGYALPDIKKALSRFGYKKQTVHDILRQLNLSDIPKKKKAMYSIHDLDEELRIYVQSMLLDYIIKEHKVGYTLEAIRNALINFGHEPKVIDEAILIIEKGKVVDYRKEPAMLKFPQQIVSSVTLFFIFAFLVFLSIATDTSILTILPNFSPAFLAFVLVNLAYFFLPNTKFLSTLPLFAVIICVAIFIAGTQYGFLGKVPGSHIILILNSAIAFVSCGIVCAFSKKGKEEVVVHIKDKKQRRLHQEEEALIEKQVHEPKLIAPIPQEPFHPKGQAYVPHVSRQVRNQVAHQIVHQAPPQAASQTAHHITHHPPTPSTSLKSLKESIDKKQTLRKHPESLEHLPEKRKYRLNKSERIPLKKFE